MPEELNPTITVDDRIDNAPSAPRAPAGSGCLVCGDELLWPGEFITRRCVFHSSSPSPSPETPAAFVPWIDPRTDNSDEDVFCVRCGIQLLRPFEINSNRCEQCRDKPQRENSPGPYREFKGRPRPKKPKPPETDKPTPAGGTPLLSPPSDEQGLALLNNFVDDHMRNLKSSRVRVWFVLYRNRHKDCLQLGEAPIAELAGISRPEVSRATSELEKLGLIKKLFHGSLRDHKAAIYRLLPVCAEAQRTCAPHSAP